jgi:hypothetical protein
VIPIKFNDQGIIARALFYFFFPFFFFLSDCAMLSSLKLSN